MTTKTASRAALVAALAAVWAVAAYLLWRSQVPSSLHLPQVPVHRLFSAAQLHASSSFGRFTTLDWALAELTQLVVFGLYAWRGYTKAKAP